jgi:hypothetical protein
MSYYQRSYYSFTDHGLQRCKERLKLQDLDDYQVHNEVFRLIKESTHKFETRQHIYIAAGNTRNYFVIDKFNNVIITCTPISAEKQMKLEMYDDYY